MRIFPEPTTGRRRLVRALLWSAAAFAGTAAHPEDMTRHHTGPTTTGHTTTASAPPVTSPLCFPVLVTDTNPAVIEATPVAAANCEVADLARLVAHHDFSRPCTDLAPASHFTAEALA